MLLLIPDRKDLQFIQLAIKERQGLLQVRGEFLPEGTNYWHASTQSSNSSRSSANFLWEKRIFLREYEPRSSLQVGSSGDFHTIDPLLPL